MKKAKTHRKRPAALVPALLTLFAVTVPVIASASEEPSDAGGSQTVSAPQTGSPSNPGLWLGLGAVALGGLVSGGIICFRQKKDGGES